MKKINLLIPLFILFTAFIAFPHNIIGHWRSSAPDNSNVYLDFSEDGTFKVTANGSIENEGKYKFANDTFYMYDNNCGMNVSGIYKITFYTKDSASFLLIDDPCKEWASEVNGGVISRIK